MFIRTPSRVLLASVAAMALGACAPTADRGEPTPEAFAARYPNDDSRNQHFVPNPAFVPQVPDFEVRRRALSREGEILIIEGDADTVTVGGPDQFGITEANQVAIVQQVLASYPDEFDTIQIYTTFVDQAHQGIAYYQGIKNTVNGIGTETFDSRGAWGLGPRGDRGAATRSSA